MTINPAIDAFIRGMQPEKIWAEILIQRSGSDFVLRHAADRERSAGELKSISPAEIRKLATFGTAGEFRPLRSAPNLARGWLLVCRGPIELWRALQEFYPGSVADWFATLNEAAPTNYRAFTGRQTGMYRITQLLDDFQAVNVTRAACHRRFCLKQRRWTVSGLEVDSAALKSEIPCLEPCAVLLELARKATRVEQEDKLSVQLSRSELESFLAAAEIAITSGVASEKVGNVAASTNPRRLQLLIEKFKDEAGRPGNSAPENEP
jgi:hypothetical protein